MRTSTFQLNSGWVFLAIVTATLNLATGQQSFNPLSLDDDETVKLSARYHIEQGTSKGFLIVKAEIPEGSYIYGLNQKSPLIPSRFSFKPDKRLRALASFRPDKSPKVIEKDPVFETRLEKHTGTVQFYVPIQLSETSNLKKYKPVIQLSGQICSEKGFCKPIDNQTVKASFAGFYEREAKKPIFGRQEKK